MPAACNIATHSTVSFNTSSLNVNLESFFFTIGWLWSRELRLTIPWQILNGSVRWGDHHVGSKSEAMPSRYSTAQFGGVTIALAGDPRQRLPVISKSSPTQIVDFGTYALAVASSGIAALLLPKGRTAHSRFKIPIDIFDDSTCNVPKQEQLAELWDEAPMQHRRCFQLVDRMLQDVLLDFVRLRIRVIGTPSVNLLGRPVTRRVRGRPGPRRLRRTRRGPPIRGSNVRDFFECAYSTSFWGGVLRIMCKNTCNPSSCPG
ncbi:BQ5605_C006g04276 [Microbotryum silenes-dioicae]|uniref:ATP-dependent DNA helicase n=1 Tax=Microbotryum silenes-dioicae TaxID=796604 RepID=A0A2X0M6H8_9BASI|nr:BQ5605_C006g04276 [Microbotryum silenes-dioicae]